METFDDAEVAIFGCGQIFDGIGGLAATTSLGKVIQAAKCLRAAGADEPANARLAWAAN